MLWWTFAALFAGLALREIYYGIVVEPGYSEPHKIFKGYVVVMLAIAATFAYLPLRKLLFERFLESKARILAGTSKVTVHCNTLFDTAVDPMSLASGHANPATGEIVLQAPWCGVLRNHLRHPERMDMRGIFSVQMFAHEVMHVRGELNEAITECEALQRHYRAARLLGIPDDIARKGGTLFYETQYKARRSIGGMQAAYYSDECAPGKQLDEHLEDSTWNSGSR
ncbi:MAG: hypothetical protein ABI082_02590 [Dokdonella sp.]